jgi:hypothetical protein
MLNVLTVYTATGVLCPNYAMRVRTYTDTKKRVLCIAKEYSAVSACFIMRYRKLDNGKYNTLRQIIRQTQFG